MKRLTIILIFSILIYGINTCSSSDDDDPIIENTFTISLSSSSISFDDLTVNSTATKDVTITNTGNQSINISSITVPNGFTLNAANATISPGTSKTITITFSPTEVKSYSGAATITSNATNTVSLGINGNAIANTFTIDLSSSSISFDDLTVNTTASKELTITNTGNQNIDISSITVPAGFSVNPTTATISPNNNQIITITFSPTEVKSYSGDVTITSNATNTPSLTINGNGIASTFTIDLSSSSISFDDLTVNTTATNDFTITNTGNQNIDISSITVPSGFSVDPTTATISPNNNQIITITFLPTEVKAYSGAVTITSNATNMPDISTNGNGIAVPETFTIDVSSTSISFDDLTVNATATRDVTITNTGNQDINISSITVPTGFSIDPTTATITPNNSEIITITFLPTEVKAYSGAVTITSNATNTPGINANGNGIAMDTFTIDVSSSSISFDDLSVNATATKDVTITNTGNQNINISSITVPSGFSVDPTTATISPNNSEIITITFLPTEVKAYSGAVTITSNATNTPSISTNGNGIAVPDTFTIDLSSSSISFDDLIVNASSTKDVTITNTGNQDINISSITVPTGFSVDPTSATITPNNSEIITITFLPTEVKAYSGAVTITSNATNTPGIDTNGNGIAPTYTADIAPIMSSKCTSCHGSTPSNGAPMSLTTLANVKDAVENRGLLVRVENGTMPPSGTDLTAAQIQAIKDWQTNGFQ